VARACVPRYTLLAVASDWRTWRDDDLDRRPNSFERGDVVLRIRRPPKASAFSANLPIASPDSQRSALLFSSQNGNLLTRGCICPLGFRFYRQLMAECCLTKLVLIVPILLIGALNSRRVLPALAGFAQHLGAARTWAGRFRPLIRIESALALVLLALVAVLTTLPPASAVASGPINLVKRTQDWNVSLRLDPNRLGKNQAVVSLHDANGRPITDAKRVTLYLQMLDMDMGLATVQAFPSGDGTYRAEVPLSMAGKWSISVEVSSHAGDTFVTEFDFSSGS